MKQERRIARRDIQRQIEDVELELKGGTDLEKQLERNARELQRAIEDLPDEDSDMADQLRKLYGLREDIIKNGNVVQAEAAKIGAKGTFNVANVLGLQAGSATDRMANGIDKIERNTRPLRDADGVAFA
jgi:hypothetical protein